MNTRRTISATVAAAVLVACCAVVLYVRDAVRPLSYWHARRTVADLRYLANRIERYRAVHSQYPSAVSVDGLQRILNVRAFPLRDGFGGELQYRRSVDGHHYRIASGGGDRHVQPGSLVSESEPVARAASGISDDIVLQDGRLIQVHGSLSNALDCPCAPN